jgi:hypothetical protein
LYGTRTAGHPPCGRHRAQPLNRSAGHPPCGHQRAQPLNRSAGHPPRTAGHPPCGRHRAQPLNRSAGHPPCGFRRAQTAPLGIRISIPGLRAYAEALSENELTGREAQAVARNTKLRTASTFKGFLVNVIRPLEGSLNGEDFTIAPREGSFTLIYGWEHLRLPANVKVVGIENPENFQHLTKQANLFSGQNLFVSRYP